jgi:hypothetical protein
MLTLIFLTFVGMFMIAGIFLSLEAKRRNDGPMVQPMISGDDGARSGGSLASAQSMGGGMGGATGDLE